jgi:hypothetical protein
LLNHSFNITDIAITIILYQNIKDINKKNIIAVSKLKNNLNKYWDLIKWDPACFLTLHEGYRPGVYYDKIKPSLLRDLILLTRSVFAGIIQLIHSIFKVHKFNNCKATIVNQPYLLLITNGTEKYASEEKEIAEYCLKNMIGIVTIYPDKVISTTYTGLSLNIEPFIKIYDYIWAFKYWILSIITQSYNIFREKKARSLFIASISLMRQYYIYTALSNRIIAIFGLPQGVLSLSTFSGRSVAVVDAMKKQGVFTAGLRTQTTTWAIEHLSINTDVLFCKSLSERKIYEGLFKGKGPRLVDACLLSLPIASDTEKLTLPDKYVLVLGTAPGIYQDYTEYRKFNHDLINVALLAGLPIVFKGHNLAESIDKEWVENEGTRLGVVYYTSNISHNIQLIKSSELVISGPSTLLYHVILNCKPIIIVNAKNRNNVPDEFLMSPIMRTDVNKLQNSFIVDWPALYKSAINAEIWIKNNFYIDKGAEYIVSYIINHNKHSK